MPGTNLKGSEREPVPGGEGETRPGAEKRAADVWDNLAESGAIASERAPLLRCGEHGEGEENRAAEVDRAAKARVATRGGVTDGR